MSSTQNLRPKLGNFSSIVCLKAIVVGMESALGSTAALAALLAAGRARGKSLVNSLGLSGKNPAPAEMASLLNAAIGENGTKLCIVEAIEQTPRGYLVRLQETVCSAGEPQGSARTLSFTLGAVTGAVEELTGKRFRSKQVESVLRGGSADVAELTEA